MRARRWALATSLLAGCGGSVPLDPPTPAFLENPGRNDGGWWDAGCPPRTKADALRDPAGEALSPNLIERLTRQFPRGTGARRLEEMLLANGFRIQARPCPNAPSIRLAEFRQTGGSPVGPNPAFAQIVWDQDPDGHILWIKALVQYIGL
jgi:hypothetical protein